jgi:hypothetical protein
MFAAGIPRLHKLRFFPKRSRGALTIDAMKVVQPRPANDRLLPPKARQRPEINPRARFRRRERDGLDKPVKCPRRAQPPRAFTPFGYNARAPELRASEKRLRLPSGFLSPKPSSMERTLSRSSSSSAGSAPSLNKIKAPNARPSKTTPNAVIICVHGMASLPFRFGKRERIRSVTFN